MQSIKISAPATVSNVGPGFDLMGFALNEPKDIMQIRKNNLNKLRIINKTQIFLPEDPEKNVASVAAKSLLKKAESDQGFDLIFEKKIHPGSGIGSSAASCTAAVVGVNFLLGDIFTKENLIEHALKGEFIASQSLHADNIAPALLGGFVLIRAYNPIDMIKLKYPKELLCIIVHPEIEIKTSESRKLIPTQVSLKDCISQAGNISSLVAGLSDNNYKLIGRSLEDKIAEPYRQQLIPGYAGLKKSLADCGVLGMNISGSGPSVFALSDNKEIALKASKIMKQSFLKNSINAKTYISKISDSGTYIIK